MVKMLPSVELTLGIKTLKQNPLCEEVLRIFKIVRPEWKAEEIRQKVLTGGISNHLFAYYTEGKFDDDVVIFRIEGEGNELMLDRKEERKHMQTLYAAGIGPPLYCVFTNGIVYGYIHGETLTPDTVTDEIVRKLITKEVVRVHKLEPDGIAETSDWLKSLSFTLLDLLPDGFPDNPEKQKRFTESIPAKSELRSELEQLWDHLSTLNSPVVFCHNDLLPANIIYNREKESVHLIDWEFSTYNHEHFEIAQHFCEHAGTDPIDLTKYPDRPYQLNWIRYYLECKAKQNGISPTGVTESAVEDCYAKVNKFALACHLVTGIWSVVQAKYSKVDFDYLGFAVVRLAEYFKRKEEFFALKIQTDWS